MTICLRVNARVFQSPGSYPWSYYFAIGNNYPEDWSKGMYEGIIHAFITVKTLQECKTVLKSQFWPHKSWILCRSVMFYSFIQNSKVAVSGSVTRTMGQLKNPDPNWGSQFKQRLAAPLAAGLRRQNMERVTVDDVATLYPVGSNKLLARIFSKLSSPKKGYIYYVGQILLHTMELP